MLEENSPISLWLNRLLLQELAPRGEVRPLLPKSETEGRKTKEEKARQKMVTRAQERLAVLENTELDRSAPMFRNVAEIGQRLGLSDLERELLELGVGVRLVHSVSSWFDTARRTRRRDLFTVIARTLDAPEQDVHRALSTKASLVQARLIELPDDRREAEFGTPEWLAELFGRNHADCDDLFASLFRDAAPSSLSADDFPHVSESLALAKSLLRSALANRTPGVNVLLYGPPAAGKTELARVIAKAAGVRLLEISVEGSEGEALSAQGRFDAYALTQRVLRGSSGELILFDEVEEALETRRMPSMMRMMEGFAAGRDKGWVNRMLEDNPGPAIWITNSVSRFDPAMLRRFTFAIELRTPPAKVRRAIIERHTQDLDVSDAWREQMAEDARLAPGHIEAAARAARMVESDGIPVEQVLTTVLTAGWSAQGLAPRPMPTHADLGAWDPDLVNTSCDLAGIAEAAATAKRGTMLLYGPPGTGKSAFAKHLADKLMRELLVRRASDLLSKWLGESEQNLAAIFAEALASGSVLLLDEADGFLADRTGAMHRWELTQVNELLVQMEAFEGIFVCATNLVDALDAAAFRRFALKIRFDPLRSDQRWRLYCATLDRFRLKADDRMRSAVDRVSDLTPGDFAAVVRGAALKGAPDSAEALLRALEEERKMKPGKARDEIGFAARLVRGGQVTPN